MSLDTHLTAVTSVPEIPNYGSEQVGVAETVPVPLPSAGGIRLSDAVEPGVLTCSMAAARQASHQDRTFPEPSGWEGIARTYDPEQLSAWQRAAPPGFLRRGTPRQRERCWRGVRL